MSNLKTQLGKRIKELRNSKNYTQESLAERVGIEQVSLSNIECGKVYPSAETLANIAASLNVKPYQLYKNDTHKPIEEVMEELYRAISQDEKLARLIHKFYLSVL